MHYIHYTVCTLTCTYVYLCILWIHNRPLRLSWINRVHETRSYKNDHRSQNIWSWKIWSWLENLQNLMWRASNPHPPTLKTPKTFKFRKKSNRLFKIVTIVLFKIKCSAIACSRSFYTTALRASESTAEKIPAAVAFANSSQRRSPCVSHTCRRASVLWRVTKPHSFAPHVRGRRGHRTDTWAPNSPRGTRVPHSFGQAVGICAMRRRSE